MALTSSSMRSVIRRIGLATGAEWLAVSALVIGLSAVLTVGAVAESLVGVDAIWKRTSIVDLDLASPDGQILQTFTYPEYQRLQDTGVFQHLAAFGRVQAMARSRQSSRPITCALVSDEYFSIRPIRTLRGRVLSTSAGLAVADRPAIIGQWLARQLFDDEPIGRRLTINSSDFVVVGVVQELGDGQQSGVQPDVWIRIAAGTGVYPDARPLPIAEELGPNGGAWLVLTGRLQPGMPLEHAQSSLRDLRFPRRGPEQRARLQPSYAQLPSTLSGRVASALGASSIGTGVLLAICLGNAMLLMVGRSARGARGRAIRYMLGASRRDVITEVVLDGVAVAAIAVCASVLVSAGFLALIRLEMPHFLGLHDLAIWPSPRVIVGVSLVGLVCGVVSALVPTLELFSLRGVPFHAKGHHGAPNAMRRETAIMFLQLVAAGLLLSLSFPLITRWQQTAHQQLGFTPENVTVAELYVDPSARSPAQRLEAYRALLDRVLAHGGAREAALASKAPITLPRDPLAIDTRPPGTIYIDTIRITPRYFSVLGIPVTEGRAFSHADRNDTVIMNATAARLSTRRVLDGSPSAPLQVGSVVRGRTLVGIVNDTRRDSAELGVEPTRYVTLDEEGAYSQMFIVVANQGSGVAAETLAAMAGSVDVSLQVMSMRTLDEQIADLTWRTRLNGQLSLSVGILGLVIAAVSSFASTANLVGRRRRDLAVMAALGATLGQLRRPVLVRTGRTAVLALGSASILTLWFGGLVLAVDPAAKDVSLLPGILISVLLILAASIASSFLATSFGGGIYRPAELLRSSEVLQ